jgi:hypothetical protein
MLNGQICFFLFRGQNLYYYANLEALCLKLNVFHSVMFMSFYEKTTLIVSNGHHTTSCYTDSSFCVGTPCVSIVIW